MLDAANFAVEDEAGSYDPVEAPLAAYSRAVANVADRGGPSVVRVESGERAHRGIGSGVIIAGDGLVLTNSHVVAGAKHLRLALDDGRETQADVYADDPDTDL